MTPTSWSRAWPETRSRKPALVATPRWQLGDEHDTSNTWLWIHARSEWLVASSHGPGPSVDPSGSAAVHAVKHNTIHRARCIPRSIATHAPLSIVRLVADPRDLGHTGVARTRAL